MLSARRFCRSQLAYSQGFWFGESNKPNTKSFNEYIAILAQATSDANEKRKDKTVDEETLRVIKSRAHLKKPKYCLDKESFRVDIGLMIDRSPIFLYSDEHELEHSKLRFKMFKKYKMLFPITKDLMDFREKIPPDNSVGAEVLTTHMRTNPDGTFDRYFAFSKEWSKTDPDIKDRKSIQYGSCTRVYLLVKPKGSNSWIFPSFPVLYDHSWHNMKQTAFHYLSESRWKVFYPHAKPLTMAQRELTEEEKKDPNNRKAVGVKTFYFGGSHMRGRIHLNPQLFEDYIWVHRYELSDFLPKEEYDKYVHSMLVY